MANEKLYDALNDWMWQESRGTGNSIAYNIALHECQSKDHEDPKACADLERIRNEGRGIKKDIEEAEVTLKNTL